MESLVSNAETIYQLESKKDHNKGVLEAYAKSIAALKESIKDFDYANSSAIQSTADALLTAQNTLLNDKPVAENPKPEVPQTEKPKTETPNTAKKEKKKKRKKKIVKNAKNSTVQKHKIRQKRISNATN